VQIFPRRVFERGAAAGELLAGAALLAGYDAAANLWLARRDPRPSRWPAAGRPLAPRDTRCFRNRVINML
jgi:hypothetical protein